MKALFSERSIEPLSERLAIFIVKWEFYFTGDKIGSRVALYTLKLLLPIGALYQGSKVRCGRMRPRAAACGECGVRALFGKVRPHEKKCGECGEIQSKSYQILQNIGLFGQFQELICKVTVRYR